MARYARAPSPALRSLLRPGGLLAPLLAGHRVGPLALDVHFREGDTVTAYVGLTRVVIARLSGDSVILDAEYRDQPGAAALLRRWQVGEPGFDEALRRYLGSVVLAAAHTANEGAVQAEWAGTRDPWFSIDREAVIGYDDTVSQVVGRRFDAVTAARAEIERLPGDRRWAQIPQGKTGEKLDQLAIDPLGRLVLVELKDASNSSAYYAPLQLLQYVCEWAEAWTQIEDQVRALAAARVEVGLSPLGMPVLRAGVRPVVAFGRDSRSEEVRRRYDLVVAVVNRHLPRGVLPVETCSMERGRPTRVP